MLAHIKRGMHYLVQSFEELLLIGILFLNVFDFLEYINPDWDYVKKIVSLTALGYLMYKASLTRIFFGVKKKKIDGLIIGSYFLLSLKDLVSYSQAIIGELKIKGAQYWATLIPVSKPPPGSQIIEITTPLQNVSLEGMNQIPVNTALNNLTNAFSIKPGLLFDTNDIFVRLNDAGSLFYLMEPRFISHRWHNLFLENNFMLQKWALIIGIGLLMIISLYLAFRSRISSPSLMHLIQEEGDPPQEFSKKISRFLIVMTVLTFFYIAIFNLTVEWLALAIDAPLVMIAIFFYLLLWLKHHTKFSPESMVYRIGNFGEEFYQKFIELFYTRRGVILGLSGMLVLHLLTDIGNYLVPYVIGLKDAFYFSQLGPHHTPLFSLADLLTGSANSLAMSELPGMLNIVDKIGLIGIYGLNILALFFLLIAPALVWYTVFSDKEIRIPSIVIALCVVSAVAFLLVPAFRFGRIATSSLAGIDVMTRSIVPTSGASIGLLYTSLIVLGIIIFYLSHLKTFRKMLISSILLGMLAFFALYVLIFFIDTAAYYITIITETFIHGIYSLSAIMLYFFGLTILFYACGLFSYLYVLFKN